MIRRKHLIVAFATILYIFTSCVNKDYKLTGDIDWTVSSDMSIVAPIGHTQLKLLDLLPDSISSFKFCVEGDEVYFSRQDTQHLGNDIIGHLKMYPHGDFNFDIDIDIDVQSGFKGTVEKSLKFYFDDINTNPNERLDSLLYKDNQYISMILTLPFAVKSDSYFEVIFDASEVVLDTEKFPDNKARFSITGNRAEVKLDISRAKIKLNGEKGFYCTLKGYFNSETEIEVQSKSEFEVKFDNIQPRITYGYLGPDRVIYETTKRVPFSYTKDLQSGDVFLPFFNPEIQLKALNSIGIPAKYMLDWVKLRNTSTGEEVYADFNGSRGTEFVLNYPTPAEIKGLSIDELINFNTPSLSKTTEFLLSRESGHTDRLFKIKGDSLEYHYRILPIGVEGENISYFFDDSKIDIAMDVKILGRFDNDKENPAKNFYVDRFDTLKIDFSDFALGKNTKLTDETVARIKLNHKNHLPVNGKGVLWFCDDSHNKILPTKIIDFDIDAALINSEGETIGETKEGNCYLKFNYDEYKELTEKGKEVIIKYKVLNEKLDKVWFKSNDWIYIMLELWVSGNVTLDLN